MISIGIIAYLEGTYYAAQAAIRKYPEGGIEAALVGSYQEGIEVSRQMVRRGAKVLISRGGYTILMREAELSVPVLDIPFTIHNFESIISSAHAKYGRIAVVGGPYVLEMARMFIDSGDDSVLFYTVNSLDDYRAAAFRAKEDAVAALVGGYDETRFASEAGVDRVIVSTNVDELDAAIREAMKVVDQIEDERRRSEKLQLMFDIISEGLILVDENGIVTHINSNARRALGESGVGRIGSKLLAGPLQSLIEQVLSTGSGADYRLQEWNGQKYSCAVKPLMVDGQLTGALAKLQEVEYVRKLEQKIRNELSQRGLVAVHCFDSILGDDPKLTSAVGKAKKYSLTDATVLITGESGTGKELFAQSIHNYSSRNDGPFVAVNCATIPANLLESELFGYTEGAFTGAKKGGKMGLCELAHQGSIFLDEIGEIDVAMQARLLRVLEEHQIMRIGDNRVMHIDIRVIAATNKNLYDMVRAGDFREDFYYRLNVLNLTLPPLRERRGDIITLVRHFVDTFSAKHSRPPLRIAPQGMEVLCRQPWPGNARELSNVIERLVITCPAQDADAGDVTEALCTPVTRELPQLRSGPALSDRLLRQIMSECGGNKSLAAERLGVSRPTLYRKLKEIGLK